MSRVSRGARYWLLAGALMNASILFLVPVVWAWSDDILLAGFAASCTATLGSTLSAIYMKWALAARVHPTSDPSG